MATLRTRIDQIFEVVQAVFNGVVQQIVAVVVIEGFFAGHRIQGNAGFKDNFGGADTNDIWSRRATLLRQRLPRQIGAVLDVRSRTKYISPTGTPRRAGGR